ncbi:MAG: molecular chaperone HtpG, partial [Acutalibacteraceae bacterium]
TLGDKVKDVVVSAKLKSHPVCLTAQGGISFEMEKYFSQMGQPGAPKAERVLELNEDHPAVIAMKSAIDTDIEKAKKYASLLYSQALLIAGLPIENPSEYTDYVCSLFV